MVTKADTSTKKTAVKKRVAAPPPSRRAATARKAKPRAKADAGDLIAAAETSDAAAPAADRLIETATRNTLAINPLIGIRASDFGGAAQALFGAARRAETRADRPFVSLGAFS